MVCFLWLGSVLFASATSLVPVARVYAASEEGTLGAVDSRPRHAERTLLTISADSFYKDQTITEDVTWRGTILVEGGVILAPQATLTVEPGTTVYFRQSGVLLIQGRVHVLGGNDKPVVFTSVFAEPAPGDWQGIVVMASEKKNSLENCRIIGAERGIDALFSRVTLKNVSFTACDTGARLQDSMVVVSGGGSTNCGIGFKFLETEADVRDANFSGNGQAIAAVASSLYLGGNTFYSNRQEAVKAEGGRVRIVGNSFSVNGSGITLMGGEGTVSANKLLKNNDYGISLAKARVKVTGNEIASNGKVGLRVEDGKGAAWSNTFSNNGAYDLYNAGSDDFRAMGNWWGDPLSGIEKRIYDKRTDASVGRVLYRPALNSKPQ